MTFRRFPDSYENVIAGFREASFSAAAWRSVLATLERLFPGSAWSLQITRDNADSPSGASGTPTSLHSRPHRAKPSPSPCRSGEVVLHCDRAGSVRLRFETQAAVTEGRDPDIAAFLGGLRAPLLRTFQIWRGLAAGEQPDPRMTLGLWDRLPYGLVLLDETLRPYLQNGAAEDQTTTRSLFHPQSRHGLRFACTDDDDRLTVAVERLLAAWQSDRPACASFNATSLRQENGVMVTLEIPGLGEEDRILRGGPPLRGRSRPAPWIVARIEWHHMAERGQTVVAANDEPIFGDMPREAGDGARRRSVIESR